MYLRSFGVNSCNLARKALFARTLNTSTKLLTADEPASVKTEGNLEEMPLDNIMPPELATDALFDDLSDEEAPSERLSKPALIDRIIRVDHAGEFGADRIYSGQHFVLQNTPSSHIIREMWKQEKYHLSKFEELMKKHAAKPTALLPFWNIAGFALGAGTALLGKEAAMACTVAVEEVIGTHYNNQIRDLLEVGPEEKEILTTLKQFRDDELEHLQTGLDQDAEKAPAYSAVRSSIATGCRAAIWISERY